MKSVRLWTTYGGRLLIADLDRGLHSGAGRLWWVEVIRAERAVELALSQIESNI